MNTYGNTNDTENPKEFIAKLTVGVVIEMAGIMLGVLQWTKMIDVTLYQAGTEALTLLHVGIFLFIVGAGLQLRAVLGRVKQQRMR